MPISKVRGPLGMDPDQQIRFYAAMIAIIFVFHGLRFWSYRGATTFVGIKPMRWLGDVCTLASFAIFIAITTVQIVLLKRSESSSGTHMSSMER